MKTFVIRIVGHTKSEEQAEKCMNSALLHGYNVEYFSGTTPDTLYEAEKIWKFDVMEPSRAYNFKGENIHKYFTKKSCFMNHVRLWHKCLELNEPIAVIEQDSFCVRNWDNIQFDELLIMNFSSDLF